jgi:hypothetical protein
MEMLTSDEVCKEIADFHPNILVAGVAKDAQFVASHFKELVWKPKSDRLRVMLGQTIVMTDIPRLNEDFFGKFRVVTVQHDNLHVLMFPLTRKPNTLDAAGMVSEVQVDECVLVLVVKPPFNHQELVSKVLMYLEATNICIQ